MLTPSFLRRRALRNHHGTGHIGLHVLAVALGQLLGLLLLIGWSGLFSLILLSK